MSDAILHWTHTDSNHDRKNHTLNCELHDADADAALNADLSFLLGLIYIKQRE